jgi:hypothetical protein
MTEKKQKQASKPRTATKLAFADNIGRTAPTPEEIERARAVHEELVDGDAEGNPIYPTRAVYIAACDKRGLSVRAIAEASGINLGTVRAAILKIHPERRRPRPPKAA